MTELSLRLQLEGNTEATVKVNLEQFTLGRSPDCDLQLRKFIGLPSSLITRIRRVQSCPPVQHN
ncbi:MAG: hypothetical protein GDA56_08345 [Hormoscilla sp. GM7CHS1pb]|nr:hypothetical protein [Hormoscilla sp. GM7CHS1pb]